MTDKPHVLDEALRSLPNWMDRPLREELLGAARRADRFIFSNAASGLIGRFCVECGDLVLRHRQFALPPFDTMYVEFQQPFFQAFINAGFQSGGDTTLGYLISGHRIYIVVRGGYNVHGEHFDDASSAIMPLYYTFAKAGEKAPIDTRQHGLTVIQAGERGDWNHLALAYGSSQMKISDEDERQSLLDQVQPFVMADYGVKLVKQYGHEAAIESATQMLRNGAGEVRNVWAALLWLNRPVHTTLTNQPSGRRFIHGKQVAFKAFRTVEIDLHKMRSLRRAFTLSGERLSPRRHKVRGAFHHKHGSFACSHEWPLIPDEDLHWKCQKCGRLRWWTKDYVRGDATRGWVDHAYSVTTGEPVQEKAP